MLTWERVVFFALTLAFAIAPAPRLLARAQASHYDLLLKGGHVIDPANDIDKVTDVAISAGKIAAVAETIPASEAEKVVDVSGLYVTPGLVDIHFHVGHGGAPLNWFAPEARSHVASWGIPADIALTAGVTTIVDAGTAGADTFLQEKEEVIDHAKVRVLAFLNIVADGMNGGLEQTVDQMDPQLCAANDREIPEDHCRSEDRALLDREAVGRGAYALGRRGSGRRMWQVGGVPVMFDFWPRPERTYAELILKKMRPGDIHTHVFAQQFPILLADGNLNPILTEARQRGVIFDVGHGAGSFWFRNAVPAVKQGFIPDSISTDLHTGSFTVLSMTEVMSKFLAMGVPLEDIIRRSTVEPGEGNPPPGTGDLVRRTRSRCRRAGSTPRPLRLHRRRICQDGWKRKGGCPHDRPGGANSVRSLGSEHGRMGEGSEAVLHPAGTAELPSGEGRRLPAELNPSGED